MDLAINYFSLRFSEFVLLRVTFDLATVMPVISTPIGILTNVPPFYRCACAILYRGENLIATSLPLSTSRFGQICSPIRLWQFCVVFDAGGKSREFCLRHLRFPLGLLTYGECNRPRCGGATVCRF